MQRTLLLALIATAMSACTRSAKAQTSAPPSDKVRKLPVSGRRTEEMLALVPAATANR